MKIQMTTFETLKKELPTEMARIKKITSTMQGNSLVIGVFRAHFGKYSHGDNYVYELARVNILRKLRKAFPLI